MFRPSLLVAGLWFICAMVRAGDERTDFDGAVKSGPFDRGGRELPRFLLTEMSALFLEFNYRHISNAGLAERNAGLNSAVGWFGASCFF